jgi:hypothetical protein
MKPSSRRSGLLLLATLLSGMADCPARAAENSRSNWGSSVGMPGKIEQLVLPGPELVVKPLEDRRAAFVVRITDAYPHGSAFRYDLVYYALEPGEYDLRNYLRRRDGSALGELPSLPVKIDEVLPPGQIEPHALELERSPWLGGYRLLLATAGSLWCAGLAALLLLGRKKHAEHLAEEAPPLALEDRLKLVVEDALAGKLPESRHAEVERLLISYWWKRLGLEQMSPLEAMSVMRDHPLAGQFLHKLEVCLHQPGARVGPTELAELLRPYRNLLAEGEEEVPATAAPSISTSQEHGA